MYKIPPGGGGGSIASKRPIALVSDCFGFVFIVSIHIPDRWQSKTLMLSTNVDQIPSETDFLDCSLFA